MKFERLRNKKSKLIFLCGFLLVVVLLITVVFKGSKAKYRSSQIIPLINSKVKNSVPDFTTMGIFVKNSSGEYEARDTIPSEKGYVINTSKSSCTKFNSATNTSEPVTGVKIYTDTLGKHVIEGINKGSKCYIYFDDGMVLGYNNIATKLLLEWGYEDVSAITERNDFGEPRTDGGNKLYKAPDDYGTSYYLVGQPENNWVKFGGYYWRIVRINGNGTLRLIYQGRTKDESGNNLDPQVTGVETYITTSPYNLYANFGYYAGFMYSEGTATGFENSSAIKSKLDTFYNNNLASVDIDKYIDKNTGFCNDRTLTSGNGYDQNASFFGGSQRGSKSKLTCPDKVNNLFTISLANNGNKKLDYPIGLISLDELTAGGLVYGVENNTNMFGTQTNYWTMSPFGAFKSSGGDFYVFMYFVFYTGMINDQVSGATNGVRPVINLVKNVTFSKGNGTSTNPFEI